MANGADDRNRHFILDGVTETAAFRSPQQGGGRPTIPKRDRERHGGTLCRQLDELHPQAEAAKEAQRQAGVDQGLGRYDRAVRYALVLSIRAPEVDVDLYTEVANRVAAAVEVEF